MPISRSVVGGFPAALATGLAGIPPVCLNAGSLGSSYFLGDGKALR